MTRRRLPVRPVPSGFSGSEMFRLATLVGLLAVITMMYFRARDPDTWRFLAKDDRKAAPETAAADSTGKADAPPSQGEGSPPAETVVSGPNDTDEDEQQGFREAAEAITDNEDLTAEEMFGYWRLFEWARRTSFADLWKRANKNVLFVHLFETPAEHRGELVGLKLHV
jgi:hypothetical protein